MDFHTLRTYSDRERTNRVIASRKHAESVNARYHSFIRFYDEFQSDGPLHGLTFSVKDVFDIHGIAPTCGLPTAFLPVAGHDAAIVQSLKSLGASCLGSTNLDELCLHSHGKNSYWGEPLNPRNPGEPSLGSSSGAAVSVASGQVDFALGTDFGGSIRLPAAACGVLGLYLPESMLPLDGCFHYGEDLDGIGFITTTASNLQVLMQVLLPSKSARTEKIFVDKALSEKHRAQLQKIFDLDEISVPIDYSEARAARKTLAGRAIWDRLKSESLHEISPESNAVIRFGMMVGDSDVRAAQKVRKSLRERLVVLLAEGSILISPTLSGGKQANEFLALANLIGVPALSLPIDSDSSIQILSLPESMNSLLGFAVKVEQIRGKP